MLGSHIPRNWIFRRVRVLIRTNQFCYKIIDPHRLLALVWTDSRYYNCYDDVYGRRWYTIADYPIMMHICLLQVAQSVFKLSLEESGVLTVCEITPLYIEDMDEVNNYNFRIARISNKNPFLDSKQYHGSLSNISRRMSNYY